MKGIRSHKQLEDYMLVDLGIGSLVSPIDQPAKNKLSSSHTLDISQDNAIQHQTSSQNSSPKMDIV